MKRNINIQELVNKALELPLETPVEVIPHLCREPHTEIIIRIDPGRTLQLSIPYLPDNITQTHIHDAAEKLRSDAAAKRPFLSRVPGFFGWWVIFAGSLSMFSVCPICGSPACPIGIGITGIVAGFMAIFKQYLKYMGSRITNIFRSHRIETGAGNENLKLN